MIIFLTLILTLTLNIDNTSEFLKSLSRVAWRSGGGQIARTPACLARQQIERLMEMPRKATYVVQTISDVDVGIDHLQHDKTTAALHRSLLASLEAVDTVAYPACLPLSGTFPP